MRERKYSDIPLQNYCLAKSQIVNDVESVVEEDAVPDEMEELINLDEDPVLL